MTDGNYFEKLLNVDATSHEPSDLIKIMGQLFDSSIDHNDIRGISKGLSIAKGVSIDNLGTTDKVTYFYFIANAWASLRRFRRYENQGSWDYEQEELTQEVINLRKSIATNGFDTVPSELKCPILTNLGNSFSHVGRVVEAQDLWHRALEVIPNYPMTIANIGMGLFYYGRCLYDESHRNIFIYHSHLRLTEALKYQTEIYPDAYESFSQLLESIKKHFSKDYLHTQHDFNSTSLGKVKKLASYRRWCLQNVLFLNPLNDLAAYTVASHDILHLPSMTVKLSDPPKYYILFNQIKQEFGSARFLFYEAVTSTKHHYSDKDIVLIDTFDYSEYSLNLEKIKITFRLLYSLFDKIAYLLNDYLELKIPKNKVTFRGLWTDKTGQLKENFKNNNNLALRGLYWLSKDLHSENDSYKAVIEPESAELAAIRNHIEHKSFRVATYGSWGESEIEGLTFSISRSRFESKTFTLLKLVRSAIIYTALAIHHEETNRKVEGHLIPFSLNTVPFKFKN